MKINFNLELFESTYTLLKGKLKTGSDRLSVPKKYSNNNFRNIDFKKLEEELLNNRYKMRPLLKKNLKNNRSIFIPCIRDRIILEILRKNLEKKKRFIKYPNRDKIIEKLIKILENKQHYSIIKLDIKKCFDNIPKNFLLKKLKEDREITDKEIYLIKQFLKYQKKGVPQGIGLSNFLAEYFLVEIDKELKKISPKISFYTRYIDDIIIILNKPIKFNEIKEIKEDILKIFSKNHMQLNKKKCKNIFQDFLNINTFIEFDYLGYTFSRGLTSKNIPQNLKIDVVSNKINDIEDKLEFCFLQYEKNKNYLLLHQRLKYLIHRSTLKKEKLFLNKNNEIKTKHFYIPLGISNTYKYVTEGTIYKKINSLLKSKNLKIDNYFLDYLHEKEDNPLSKNDIYFKHPKTLKACKNELKRIIKYPKKNSSYKYLKVIYLQKVIIKKEKLPS